MKHLTSITIFAFLNIYSLVGQVNQTDPNQNFLIQKEFDEHKYDKRQVKYLFADNNSVLVKYNPVSLVFGGMLLFYQKVISQQLGSNCPYEISCSEFSRLSISEYGLLKGVALTADRLTRCTEFTKLDVTPLWFNSDYKIIDPIERYKLHDNHQH